jgi:hypothetical protein
MSHLTALALTVSIRSSSHSACCDWLSGFWLNYATYFTYLPLVVVCFLITSPLPYGYSSGVAIVYLKLWAQFLRVNI